MTILIFLLIKYYKYFEKFLYTINSYSVYIIAIIFIGSIISKYYKNRFLDKVYNNKYIKHYNSKNNYGVRYSSKNKRLKL